MTLTLTTMTLISSLTLIFWNVPACQNEVSIVVLALGSLGHSIFTDWLIDWSRWRLSKARALQRRQTDTQTHSDWNNSTPHWKLVVKVEHKNERTVEDCPRVYVSLAVWGGNRLRSRLESTWASEVESSRVDCLGASAPLLNFSRQWWLQCYTLL